LYVTVQRGSTEFNLTGITLTAGTEGTTKAIVIKAGASGVFADSGISMYNNGILDQNIVTPGPSERRTYAINISKFELDSASIVSINPMLKGLCDESDKKDIPVFP
jgi:hypothetical protein